MTTKQIQTALTSPDDPAMDAMMGGPGSAKALLRSYAATMTATKELSGAGSVEWGTAIEDGQKFDLSNSFADWMIEGQSMNHGSYTRFYFDNANLFTVPGLLTPQEAVQYVRAYKLGQANGRERGRDEARSQMKSALGL